MEKINQLINEYETKKSEIESRLKEFKSMLNKSDERVFAELAFCLCTPQSNAIKAWNAISILMKNNLLYEGDEKEISKFLSSVRFADKKTKYIVKAREFFTENGKIKIKRKIQLFKNVFELREWLVRNVKGFGYKEATHFLRNIGLVGNLSILDRHILKNLKEFEVISEIPRSLTKKRYLEIEVKMREFAKKINIPIDELDLVLWSEETGVIFK